MTSPLPLPGFCRKQMISFVFPAVVSEAQKWPQEVQLVL